MTLLWTALFVLSLLLQYASFAAPAKTLGYVGDSASSPFELDGNAVHAAGHDWDQVYADRNAATPTSSGANDVVFVTDKTGLGDDILTGGNTKDIANFDQWLWKQSSTTSVQDKDDIENAFAASYTAQNGHTVGYFGLDRYSISGDATAGFWFLKNNVAKTGNGSGNGTGFNGVHAEGDVLVVIDFTNGGANGSATVYKWHNGALSLDTSGTECDGSAQSVCAITNTSDANSPWPYTPKDGTANVFPAAPVKNGSQGAGALYEGGIDMTDLGLDTACFSSFIAETRSSQQTTATLSDFVMGSFSFCATPDLQTQVKQDGTNVSSISLGESVQDVATLTGSKGTVTGSVDFFVCGPEASAPDCSTGGTQVGGTKTLSGGTATSASFTPTQAGLYCFRAEYTPVDGNHYLATSHTNRTTECFEAKAAHIQVDKTADAASVDAGDQIGFTVTVSNTGAGQAKGISFSDSLPSGTGVSWTLDAANSDPGWAVSGTAPNQTLTFSGTTLNAGASTSAHVVSDTTKDSCKTYDNTASVSTTNDGSDSDSASVTVNCASIGITKTADDETVSAGAQIGFVVTITNSGAGQAKGLSFSDTLPSGAGVSWSVDAAHSSSGWSVSGSAPNQTLVYTPTTLDGNSSTHVHVVSSTTKDSCKEYDNTASVTTTNDGSGSDSASTTVLCPVIQVEKTADAATVNAGDQIGFTVTLSNTGDGDATGLSFSDPLPAGSGVSWSISPASAGWSITGTAPNQHLVYSPTTLAAATSTSVHVVSSTTAASCGTYDNTAQASAANDGSDSASASVTVNCPDVTVEKTADASPISAGDTAAFTIVVSNVGVGTATNVTLHDPLPAGIDWAIDPAVTGCSIANNTLDCSFASLAPNGSVTIHISGETVAANCGTLNNTATVGASNEPDSATDNNQDSASIEVDCPVISITKTADDATVSAGDQIGFTIEVTNNGAGTAQGVVVDDVLPTQAGLSWSIDTAGSSSGWTIVSGHLTYGPASLAPGASSHVHIVSATTADSCGDIPNTASVTTSNDGSDSDDATVTVECPNVTVEKTADKGTINAGDTAAFTIVVSNAGPGTAKDVTLSDPLPAGVDWAIDPAVSGCSIASGTLSCAWATLAADGSVTIHISGVTDKADCGTLPNTATVAASNEADTSDNQSTAMITVNCAVIDIQKVADEPSVSAGSDIGFTITVTNNGEGDAYGVHVSDPLPTDAGTSWSIDEGPTGASGVTCGIASGSLTCDVAVLAAGDSFSLHITSPTTKATVADSPVYNEASVTTTNDGSDTDHDQVVVLGAQIDIEKVADAPVVEAGTQAGFTITVTNNGDGTATGVHVSDPLPTDAGTSWTIESGPDYCAIDAGELTCDVASLASGASFSIHIVSPTTDATIGDSPIDNTATVTTTNDGSDQASDSIRVPGLTIEKSFTGNSAGTDSVLNVPKAKEGDTLTYTLTYTLVNGPVTDAFITDTLPQGLAYIDGTATGNEEFSFTTFDTSMRTLRWDAATLTASGSVTYQVRVLDGAAGLPQPLVNTATIDSNETAPSSDQASVAVAPPPLPATGTPKPTLPPTDTLQSTTPAQPNVGFSLMVVLLGLAGIALGIGLLVPVPESARRRNRR